MKSNIILYTMVTVLTLAGCGPSRSYDSQDPVLDCDVNSTFPFNVTPNSIPNSYFVVNDKGQVCFKGQDGTTTTLYQESSCGESIFLVCGSKGDFTYCPTPYHSYYYIRDLDTGTELIRCRP